MTSHQASKLFRDNSLDCVFIDGSHTYKDLNLDIKSLINKVKKDGIFAGHDYNVKFPGVIKAVNENLDPLIKHDIWQKSLDR